MITKSKYQDWRVWKDSIELAVKIIEFGFPGVFTNQIERAVISISANIAEGAAKGKGYTWNHLRHAKGSAAEVETYLILCNKLGIINNQDLGELTSMTSSIQAQLGKLITSIRIQHLEE